MNVEYILILCYLIRIPREFIANDFEWIQIWSGDKKTKSLTVVVVVEVNVHIFVIVLLCAKCVWCNLEKKVFTYS